MQHTASLLGSAIQRGLAKEAHKNGHVENNEFANLNKQHFSYENGMVVIDYPRLLLSTGLVDQVEFLPRNRGKQRKLSAGGHHVEMKFDPCLGSSHTHPDDVVHIYAVEFNVEVCELVASVERHAGQVTFDLPNLSDETDKAIFHLFAIVEAANTACIPTLSPDEKRTDKSHRNIDHRVSPSVFIGTVTVNKH